MKKNDVLGLNIVEGKDIFMLAVALGFMRSNIPLTTLSMAVGKLIRYIILLWAMQESLQLIL